MSLKSVYAIVACVYFCDRIFNFFFSLKTMPRHVRPILFHFCHWDETHIVAK